MPVSNHAWIQTMDAHQLFSCDPSWLLYTGTAVRHAASRNFHTAAISCRLIAASAAWLAEEELPTYARPSSKEALSSADAPAPAAHPHARVPPTPVTP